MLRKVVKVLFLFFAYDKSSQPTPSRCLHCYRIRLNVAAGCFRRRYRPWSRMDGQRRARRCDEGRLMREVVK